MEKLIKNGCVAVLVSHGYGAGWYTWRHDEAMLFDPVLAEMLENGADEDKLMKVAKQRYPDAYLGGIDGLTVHWVPVGKRFRIEEYDGSEGLMLEDQYYWSVA